MTGLLDREKGDTYTLTVVADDGGPKKDSTVVCLFLLVSSPGLCSFAFLRAMSHYIVCVLL